MRALELKIKVDCLVLYKWDEWKREDQDYIRKQAERNLLHLVYNDEEPGTVTFKGTYESLFGFMYDVAYRYDLEIM